MNRTEVLLRAAKEILTKCRDSEFVVSPMETTAFYDEADCDGHCLLDDIESHLEQEEANRNKNVLNKGFVVLELHDGDPIDHYLIREADFVYRRVEETQAYVFKSRHHNSGEYTMEQVNAMIKEGKATANGESE